MAIENVELMHESCHKRLSMGTTIMEIIQRKEKKTSRKKIIRKEAKWARNRGPKDLTIALPNLPIEWLLLETMDELYTQLT